MEEHTLPLSNVEIIRAVQSRDIEKIRSLRQADEKVVTNCDEKGYTAFHWAAFSDDVEVFDLLMEGSYRYVWECRTSIGLTCLHVACATNSVRIVRKIVEILKSNPSSAGHINDQNAFMETPLHVAAMANDIEIAQILLGGGADVSAVDKLNRTARRVRILGYFIPFIFHEIIILYFSRLHWKMETLCWRRCCPLMQMMI